jgi:hypothetical protein
VVVVASLRAERQRSRQYVPEREVLVHRQDWSLDRSLDWSLN